MVMQNCKAENLVLRPVASASSGNLLETQILSPPLRPAESGTPGWGPAVL